MEVKPGYKQTEVGIIPEDWDVDALERITDPKYPICYGIVQVGQFWNGGVNVLAIKNLDGDYRTNIHRCSPKIEKPYVRSRVRPGDILISVKGTIGSVGLVPIHYVGNISRDLARISLTDSDVPAFWYQLLQGPITQRRLEATTVGTTRRELSIGPLKKVKMPRPSKPEQCIIGQVLGDMDKLLNKLDQLIAKKNDLKQAAMQQLLTGKMRLSGFRDGWNLKPISAIATPASEKNVKAARLPVLACSKHLGFVNSLMFFKNQVFSKDLSSYRVIRRDEIGYPANHVEEGSIGLQDLYDVALVSPIYVVFRVNEEVDSYFMHRLLKLDAYRQKFKIATTSSVDRRGSLRWPAFSQITVRLPPTKREQTAIAEVLRDMELELAVLEQRREKTRAVKQAMMQELLTGKTRLV